MLTIRIRVLEEWCRKMRMELGQSRQHRGDTIEKQHMQEMLGRIEQNLRLAQEMLRR